MLSDAKLKGFNDMSMSAKLSLMSVARVIASLAIATLMEPQAQPSLEWNAAGFFDHWTLATWIVTLSFTSKSLITLYLLKSLDGIQKNVGEAGLVLCCVMLCSKPNLWNFVQLHGPKVTGSQGDHLGSPAPHTNVSQTLSQRLP